jgi:hypothetical protein
MDWTLFSQLLVTFSVAALGAGAHQGAARGQRAGSVAHAGLRLGVFRYSAETSSRVGHFFISTRASYFS